MKHHYFLKTLFLLGAFAILSSCGSDDDDYVPVTPVSPVQLDLAAVPYNKLSEYKFYEGAMKNLQPAYKVIPYDLNSSLFTDYAKKKRFVWMPEGAKATYDADGKVLNFPTGTVLIKNFYYDNVQPSNTTRIIETRLLIKKADGWIFADYVWNNEQTEATLDNAGGLVNISWLENGTPKTAEYKIPSVQECFICHQNNNIRVPIGPKPQNLNKNFTYADGTKNQLSKWIETGYLTSVPQNITSTVDWTDTSKPLAARARSYLDINCAHCHSEGGDCSQISLRLNFGDTANNSNLGVCVSAVQSPENYLVSGRAPENSALFARMITNEPSLQMPLVGRSMVHEEAKLLIEEWINSLDNCE
ncbi:hypothetical protein CHU92_08690 [Flavobacterium cyanobacteriorum]|uniref:Cytochrome c domain-containing protein n=1 Tax=Flavobacterium cyanobacteriorum TaxID=2022802 RepID=A0A255Z8J3_9FLAO|nr:hypothetical protein [Flavobacterium cyanobacteriorum]OYQ37205.1 hypothetical protein CHU92_08690 [Flavobacterium cyanobacteriorum]